MERSTMLLRTVNHLFLWAIYTMAVLNNQRVILPINLCNLVTVAFSYTPNNSHQKIGVYIYMYIYNVMVF